jgi:hypothetical protein
MIPAESLVLIVAGALGSISSAVVAAVKSRRERAAAPTRRSRSVVLEVEGRKVDLSDESLVEQERRVHELLTEPEPKDSA